jgi:hypothetical protein
MKGLINMKKSEMYRMAQMAVVSSGSISPNVKVEIVKELIQAESLEQWREEQAEKEAEKEAVKRSLQNTMA